jgi:hypothetical protein
MCILTAILLFPLTAPAQDSVKSHPGYFPLEDLAILADAKIEIDVDLAGAMLALVAGATKEKDPEFSDLVSNIKRIRVLVGELDDSDFSDAVAKIDDASDRLKADGWNLIVKVRDEEEVIRFLVREIDSTIQGITVLLIDDNEVSLVNIVGQVDPAMIGKLGGIGIPDLDDLGVDFN